jgi:hypothetical protein
MSLQAPKPPAGILVNLQILIIMGSDML